MRTLDEVKKDSKKYKRSETVGPAKDVFMKNILLQSRRLRVGR